MVLPAYAGAAMEMNDKTLALWLLRQMSLQPCARSMLALAVSSGRSPKLACAIRWTYSACFYTAVYVHLHTYNVYIYIYARPPPKIYAYAFVDHGAWGARNTVMLKKIQNF